MHLSTRLLGRAVFGVAVVTSLGFGTAQAFATTGTSRSPATARSCDDYTCDRDCRNLGYEYGSCHWDSQTCICYMAS